MKKYDNKKDILLFITWHFKEFYSLDDISFNNEEILKDFNSNLCNNVCNLHYHDVNFDIPLFVFHLIHKSERSQYQIHQFIDSDTGKIGDDVKFREICNSIKSKWKNSLIENFPNYNREKLENGFDEIKFDYFYSKSSLIVSLLLRSFNENYFDELANISQKIKPELI